MKRFNIYEEANRCLLCQDAPCTKACPTGDPARALRAIRFDNHKPALRFVADCTDADLEAAERACIHYNPPIRIRDIIHAISPDDVDDTHYPDLAIDFCGIRCENPVDMDFDILHLRQAPRPHPRHSQDDTQPHQHIPACSGRILKRC